MRKLILSLLVVASLGACNNEKNEVGRYQYFPMTERSIKHKVFDTKTGKVYYFDDGDIVITQDYINRVITQDSLKNIRRYHYIY
jgi:hypothetical protein